MNRFIPLLLLPVALSVNAWEYVVVDNSQMDTYRTETPPVDLSYPPLGVDVETIDSGEIPTGETISAQQLSAEQDEPHLIIIPSRLTQGQATSTRTLR